MEKQGMNKYVLSCCSTADLSAEHFERRNVSVLGFHFFIDGKEYVDDFGKTLSYDEFYAKMVAGADTKTSQPNVQDYINYFMPMLEAGRDVLHVSISSGISGASNSARIAAEELAEKYPERKLYIVDSLAASSGFGLFVDKLADKRDEGADIDELRSYAEQLKLSVHHWFFSTDLTFFVKGGRVSKVSGWFGTALKICPLLNVSVDGKLVPRFKIRGKNNVIREIVKKMEEFAKGGADYADKCYMCHSACLEDAKAVAALVEEKFPNLRGKVVINNIGTTIGSHTGPGTVALFFIGKERDN